MIIEDQKISIRISGSNIGYYRSIGYKDVKCGDELEIYPHELTKGCQKKVAVKCDYCGKIVYPAYRDYLHYKYDKYSCEKCRQRKTSEYNLPQRQKYLYDQILKVCKEKGYTLITKKEEIKTSSTRVKYKCPKHGIHETKAYTLFLGYGCLDCAYEENGDKNRKDPSTVYNDFLKYGGVLLNKEDYIDWNTKNLKVICKECGDVFVTSYGSFVNGHGQVCPNCLGYISKGEYEVKHYLESKNIKYTREYRFKDCRRKIALPFDFYLPELNVCIEYDGAGHYKPIPRGMTDSEAEELLEDIKERDEIKTNYCIEKGIKLIRIPYWEFDNIGTILDKELFT